MVAYKCRAFALVFFIILMLGKVVAFVQTYQTPLAKLKKKRRKLRAEGTDDKTN